MLPACWPSLGQLMGSNWAILSDFDVIMFFRKDRPQREGSFCAHPRINLPPERPSAWCTERSAAESRVRTRHEQRASILYRVHDSHRHRDCGIGSGNIAIGVDLLVTDLHNTRPI